MTTALQIINRAAELIGYKDPDEPLTGNEAANFLGVLNGIVDEWNTKRLYIVTVAETVASVSTSPATIGAGQTINVARPVRLEPGCFARSGGVDYPLTIITREQFDAIPLKSTASDIPTWIYYDAGVPTGNVYLYPAPSGSVSLHLQLAQQLAEFADLSTNYSLAPGYRKALEYTLAEELTPGRAPANAKLDKLAAAARTSIRQVNLTIPEMTGGAYYSPLERIRHPP